MTEQDRRHEKRIAWAIMLLAYWFCGLVSWAAIEAMLYAIRH
jgi:hypothetical protein